MRIIDVHGAHVLDFERFHLDQGELTESRELGYSVLDCIKDIKEFLYKDPKNITTIMPPPSPIFNSMVGGGRYDFDVFPFHYENTQLLQIMTFLSKLGLEDRVFPYFGFTTDSSKDYNNYLQQLSEKTKCGFKFHALAMKKAISELKGSPALEIASKKGLPLLVHTGGDGFSDSRQLVNLAESYPDVNFCAAHLGYLRREFLEALPRLPNLFTDTCILSALLTEIKEGKEKHIDTQSIPPEVRDKPIDEIFRWLVGAYGIENKILFSKQTCNGSMRRIANWILSW